MTDVARPISPRRPLGTGTFALLTLGFLAFVFYGSLVPFHYEPLSWPETFARWDQVRREPLGIGSRSDFVANVLLFIPVGYLLAGTLAVDRGRAVSFLAAALVMPLGTALSASVEFTQLWFPPRVSSLNDVAAETLGGVLGATAWFVAGQRITDYARSVWAAAGPANLAVAVLPGYLCALVVIHVMPLDLTLSPAEVYRKWKEGHIVLIPFTADYGGLPRLLLKCAWNAAYFLPLGVILAAWPGRVFRRPERVLAAGLCVAAGIEFLQLFVVSRYFDVTDIVTGTAAVGLGWLALEACKARRTAVVIRPALLLAWILVMVFVNWFPFDVVPEGAAGRPGDWVLSADGRHVTPPNGGAPLRVRAAGPFLILADRAVVYDRLAGTPPVPLVDLYYGTPYHAFDEVVQKTLLFLPLGMLLVPRPPAAGRRGLWRALLAGLALACLFEAGQLLAPGRTCSTTDVLVQTCGAVLGFVLGRRFLTPPEDRPTVESFPPAGDGDPSRRPAGLGVFVTEEAIQG